MSLFKGKYRVESVRHKNYDYSSPGSYFATICTKGMICYFGKIVNSRMRLNEIGAVVDEEWKKTKIIRPNVDLGAWVAMPNHVHGIIIITNNMGGIVVEPSRRDGSTTEPPTLKPNSLGFIINQIKSVATKRIRSMGYNDFNWQAGYYDTIILNQQVNENIQRYFENNPVKWEKEKQFSPISIHNNNVP